MTTISRSKGTVRFAFRDSNAKLENNKKIQSLIILNFAYGQTRFRYSTGYKSCFDDWDFKKQRVKNKASISNKDEINNFLGELENFLYKTYSRLSKEQGTISKDVLKYHLDIFTKKIEPEGNESPKNLTFFDVIDEFIKLKENSDTKNVTVRSYKQTKKKLKGYEKYYNTRLIFSSINMDFYNKFRDYMEAENYALNTIGKHIKSLKTFLNYAVIEGYTTNQKYKNKQFAVSKEITTEIYLSEEEIEAFKNFDLSKYPKLSHARDLFLIGYYTGQRVSDYNSFKKEDIQNINGQDCFVFVQQKNRKKGKIVRCPITKEIREIMDLRHNGLPPKRIPDKDINDYIKQIGQMLDIESLNKIIKCEYTKAGKQVIEMLPKYKLIKSHTARRSFATNMYKKGMPVYDIMLFTGHTTEKEFYKYIRIKDEERTSHVLNAGYFNV